MKTIMLLLISTLLSIPAFASSVLNFNCSPFAVYSGAAYLIQVYQSTADSTSTLKVIRQGPSVETVQTQKILGADGVKFIDIASHGENLSLTIKNTLIKDAGYVSLFFENGVNASYSCSRVH